MGDPVDKLNRRNFLQISTGAALAGASGRLAAATAEPAIANQPGSIKVTGSNYTWEYTQAEDGFTVHDANFLKIVSGKIQPVVVVAPTDDPSQRVASAGKAAQPVVAGNKVTFEYEGVNGEARLSITWRFDEGGFWIDPIVYESTASHEIVSVHYFADSDGTKHTPSLYSSYLVVPGISEGSAISPILWDSVKLDERVWLGRGSFIPGLLQQWGLPVHYFCGFSVESPMGADRDMFVKGRSAAYTCGLADLPGGDLFLQLNEGGSSLWIDYRSDVWKHLHGPGRLTLGATLYWSVAPDYYESIAGYYDGLLRSGVVKRPHNSEEKTAVKVIPQYCTWGAQRMRHKTDVLLNEKFLNDVYGDLKASGMKAGLFSIDDKWEGTYGKLEHSSERLPHFEEFLARLRADGYKLGIWAALMRCEHPADMGLTEANMLQGADGKPYIVPNWGKPSYYILDFTQPVVEKVLVELVRKFMRRYKPDLLKFDFGYELPSVAAAAPQDKAWSGERLMLRGIDIVVKAMRQENPDIVVMYYNLSPLFLDYFDMNATDDLFMVQGEYDLEANRRIYFSGLMGALGVTTYGSSGYDWASAPSIWFDSAASGSIGTLNDLVRDEEGESVTPELAAKFNGVAKTLRPTAVFKIEPIGTVSQAPTRGAHARSWARYEGGQLVLLAYRPEPAGEENPLGSKLSDPKMRGVVTSSGPVIVSSKTAEGIEHSDSLVLVAYADGEIVLRRSSGKSAEIVSHYFGGASTKSDAKIIEGQLRLKAVPRDADGAPLEWIEVKIA
jgi:hypothetical protein